MHDGVKKIGVFGCTGLLGRLVAQQVMEAIQGQADLRMLLAGRDKLGLERLSMELGRRYKQPVDIHPCNAEDRQALRGVCEPCDVVISCVAPYSVAGTNLFATAVHGKSHLLDASIEASFVADCLGRSDSVGKAGIVVVNSMGVRAALAGAAAEQAARTFPGLETVSVLYMYVDPPETPGTRKVSFQNMTTPARALVDGQVVEAAYASHKKTFQWPGGKGKGVLAGGAEAMQLTRHLKTATEIRAYTQSEGFKGMFMPLAAKVVQGLANVPQVQKWLNAPERPSTDGSSFAIIVELESKMGRRFSVLQGRSIYDTTAKLLARAAMRLVTDGPKVKGVVAPCEAFEADWILKTVGLEPQTADAAPA